MFLIIALFIGFGGYAIIKTPISNIYISGNSTLKDQDIIELAGLENYPSTIENSSFIIKNKLKKSNMIIDVKVYKKRLTKVYIEVVENRPLFYNSNTNKTVMLDKTEQSLEQSTPYLLNYIPDTIYDKFIEAMTKINIDVLNRISEIQYSPNEVDERRFYLAMDDGNYVYLTLNTFDKINNYVNIVKQFNNKKGILYLDSGEYFEIK